jgi:hypothetical protein
MLVDWWLVTAGTLIVLILTTIVVTSLFLVGSYGVRSISIDTLLLVFVKLPKFPARLAVRASKSQQNFTGKNALPLNAGHFAIADEFPSLSRHRN